MVPIACMCGPIVLHSRNVQGFACQNHFWHLPPVRAKGLGCSLEVGPQIIQLIITQIIQRHI